MKCLECEEPAVFVRSTQFSGEHPYCDNHAKQEEDFFVNDPSYQLWYRLDTDDVEAKFE